MGRRGTQMKTCTFGKDFPEHRITVKYVQNRDVQDDTDDKTRIAIVLNEWSKGPKSALFYFDNDREAADWIINMYHALKKINKLILRFRRKGNPERMAETFIKSARAKTQLPFPKLYEMITVGGGNEAGGNEAVTLSE